MGDGLSSFSSSLYARSAGAKGTMEGEGKRMCRINERKEQSKNRAGAEHRKGRKEPQDGMGWIREPASQRMTSRAEWGSAAN